MVLQNVIDATFSSTEMQIVGDNEALRYYHTHPLFRGGADYICESPLGGSCLVMNIHNPFMHLMMSKYVFKSHDGILLLRAVTLVAA